MLATSVCEPSPGTSSEPVTRVGLVREPAGRDRHVVELHDQAAAIRERRDPQLELERARERELDTAAAPGSGRAACRSRRSRSGRCRARHAASMQDQKQLVPSGAGAHASPPVTPHPITDAVVSGGLLLGETVDGAEAVDELVAADADDLAAGEQLAQDRRARARPTARRRWGRAPRRCRGRSSRSSPGSAGRRRGAAAASEASPPRAACRRRRACRAGGADSRRAAPRSRRSHRPRRRRPRCPRRRSARCRRRARRCRRPRSPRRARAPARAPSQSARRCSICSRVRPRPRFGCSRHVSVVSSVPRPLPSIEPPSSTKSAAKQGSPSSLARRVGIASSRCQGGYLPPQAS